MLNAVEKEYFVLYSQPEPTTPHPKSISESGETELGHTSGTLFQEGVELQSQ